MKNRNFYELIERDTNMNPGLVLRLIIETITNIEEILTIQKIKMIEKAIVTMKLTC